MKKELYSSSFVSLHDQSQAIQILAYQHLEFAYLAWWFDSHIDPGTDSNKSSHSFNKVFCVGFNKTGTKSLHALFLELGLRSYHGEGWRDGLSCAALLADNDAFLDDTIPLDFAALDAKFPDSRFVLHTRPLEDWLISRLRHIDRNRANPNYNRTWLRSDDETLATWVQQRQNYHCEVLNYFSARPHDLLAIVFCNDLHAHTAVTEFLKLSQSSSSFKRPYRGAWHQHRFAEPLPGR